MMDHLDLKVRDFYATFINLDAIKTFVRKELGCQCEDKVFDQTVIGVPSVFSDDNPGWDLQILIGFRLLYLLPQFKRSDLLVMISVKCCKQVKQCVISMV